MRIILLGAPGSGKGTLGEMIAQATGFPRLSTGDLLRKAVREATPLGRRAEAVMTSGGLVDDAVVTDMIRERIAEPDARAGYILDGFPRTLAQAEALEAIDPRRPEIVLDIEVGGPTVVARLGGRRVCSACGAVYHVSHKPPAAAGACDVCGTALIHRADDAEEVVRERLRVYREAAEPLRGHYRNRGTLKPVDGEGTAGEVFERVRPVVAEARRRSLEGRPS